ncbi:hypothetical protein [Pontibacter ummariensis]|uniref:hypothetical protein n=1 Tax=Pontibacter ummariensis TaxID=1610492 RepID=UPI000B7717E3|nr:hypothetical protein [Pontibacter ummariensis]
MSPAAGACAAVDLLQGNAWTSVVIASNSSSSAADVLQALLAQLVHALLGGLIVLPYSYRGYTVDEIFFMVREKRQAYPRAESKA